MLHLLERYQELITNSLDLLSFLLVTPEIMRIMARPIGRTLGTAIGFSWVAVNYGLVIFGPFYFATHRSSMPMVLGIPSWGALALGSMAIYGFILHRYILPKQNAVGELVERLLDYSYDDYGPVARDSFGKLQITARPSAFSRKLFWVGAMLFFISRVIAFALAIAKLSTGEAAAALAGGVR